MSEILKVLNRKSVELKSEVVEFSLIEDIKKEYNSLSKSIANGNKRASTLKAEKAALQGDAAEVVDNIGKSEDVYNKIVLAAKELGIKAPKEAETLKKLISDADTELDSWEKQFNI